MSTTDSLNSLGQRRTPQPDADQLDQVKLARQQLVLRASGPEELWQRGKRSRFSFKDQLQLLKEEVADLSRGPSTRSRARMVRNRALW